MMRLLNLCILIAAVHGKHRHDSPSSIINGDLANIEDFPYFIFLNYADSNGVRYYCGGSIIRPDIILTAAHCLITAVDIKVFVGITTLTDMDTATPYEAETVQLHPEFYYEQWDYDVGLVKLKRNITLDGVKVDAINLARNNPPIGASTSVMGFGVTTFNIEEQLRSALVKVVNIGCYGIIYTSRVTQNACRGDSGGPIVYDGEVIAVVSAGRCTGADTQASIPFNYCWLKNAMNRL